MKQITVYCASSSQIDALYFDAAQKLGKMFATNNIRLIYGGGSVGVMGALADSVLEHGGEVRGVIPRFMCEVEWQHNGLTELILTDTMHQRKERMAMLGDATIALPGGCGTLEELLEIITWKQLGIYTKPIVIANINHYYDDLIAQLQRASEEMFLRPEHLQLWTVVTDVNDVFDALKNAPKIDEKIRRIAKI